MRTDHHDRIVDQFTRQAAGFASAPAIRDQEFLGRIVRIAETGAHDTVLDVACGPGLLACAFARAALHVTGIDLTPAMLEQARILQREQALQNVAWMQGDVLPLPFDDGAFSIVTARFAFHHFLDPLAVLREMRRVCKTGGRVVVADSAPAPEKAEAFNEMERLRDPSHVRAMPMDELRNLFRTAGLPEPRVETYGMKAELEGLLQRSFPEKGGADRIREIFENSLAGDTLGMATRRKKGTIVLVYPIAILASRLA
ncbi:MAG TPA: methyltransferase domain-containing protein [Candidatus Acidoferrales bacterium]|nr:methyltransferase domain-containing protein [Candidatus Acidoferrales bacterium]